MSIPLAGTVIDRYKIEGVIGAGSMGDVLVGVDTDLHRKVAIKILSEKHRDDEELEARFVREGRAVAAISHTNVVQVFTTGTYDGRPYIAMEFLTGSDLGSFVAKRGPMSSLHAAQAILDTAHGLQAAAEADLIHRDVKPANLVMLDSGKVKVTDFGLAKPMSPSNEPALTALGVVVGTPDYIAPEQARGDAIDERVDLYSLGGTLYFLLIGTPPFRKGNPVDDKYLKVVARHLNDPAPNPMLVNPDIDGQLARLQLRLMSKKPKSRPGYVELIEELESIVARLKGKRSQTAPQAMAVEDPTATSSSPTPFLGRRQQAAEVANSQTNAEESDTGAADSASRTPSESLSDSVSGDDSLFLAATTPSPLLKLLTIVSAIVLLAGAALYFFGPMPSPASPETTQQVVIDAGIKTTEKLIPDARPAPLVAPEGMLVIHPDQPEQAFFISEYPVRYGEYSSIFPREKPPSKNAKRQKAAVDRLTPAKANSYAHIKGARLPTEQEWRAAQVHKGYQTPARFSEWLAGSDDKSPTTIDSAGKLNKRRAKAYLKVGFRLVIDPS